MRRAKRPIFGPKSFPSRPEISLQNFSRARAVPERFLKETVARVLEAQGIVRGSVTLVLVDSRRIRALNKKFLGRDGRTDVLSFDLGAPGAHRLKSELIADVAVCVAAARCACRRIGLDLHEELARYVIHGLLHLLGYNDNSQANKKRMWRRQEGLLKEIMGRKVARDNGRR